MQTVIKNTKWEHIKDDLKGKMPLPFYESFIRPLSCEENEDSIIFVAPTEKIMSHVSLKYKSIIEDAFPGKEVAFKLHKAPIITHESEMIVEHTGYYDSLKNLSFPGSLAFLYGPNGCGKTYLANQYFSSQQGVRFLTLENFLTEFTSSIKNQTTVAWRKNLRQYDLLIIDEFQFIKKNARSSLEELHHLIDEFAASQKKIILISDIHPSMLDLPGNVQSRFFSAPAFPVRFLSKEGKMKILYREWSKLNYKENKEIAELLTERIRYDLRRLKSAALSIASGAHITQIEHLFDSPVPVHPDLIVSEVAIFYNISVDAIKGPARDKKFVQARYACIWLLDRLTGLKQAEIARLLGRKDHTSTTRALEKIEELISQDLFFKSQLENLCLKIEEASCSF